MWPFKNFGLTDRTERKALLFAVLSTAIFISVISFVPAPVARSRKRLPARILVPLECAPVTLPESEPPVLVRDDPVPVRDDLLGRFRAIPENFLNVDFANRSYGPYTSSDGTKIDLRLKSAALDLPNDSGWFALKDVFYTDVTGDGEAEAIVRLTHVDCGGSCDRRSDLIYIYTLHNRELKTIWQYETGNYVYGCGLKSLTVSGTMVMLELFGDYPKCGVGEPESERFAVSGFTALRFEFNGTRIVPKNIDYYVTPKRNVMRYEPSIRMF